MRGIAPSLKVCSFFSCLTFHRLIPIRRISQKFLSTLKSKAPESSKTGLLKLMKLWILTHLPTDLKPVTADENSHFYTLFTQFRHTFLNPPLVINRIKNAPYWCQIGFSKPDKSACDYKPNLHTKTWHKSTFFQKFLIPLCENIFNKYAQVDFILDRKQLW